jgi:hypothetical protein
MFARLLQQAMPLSRHDGLSWQKPKMLSMVALSMSSMSMMAGLGMNQLRPRKLQSRLGQRHG